MASNVSGVSTNNRNDNTQDRRKTIAQTRGGDVKPVVIEQGKGLYALAKVNNMSLKDFCHLNGISEDYQPRAGEVFYVKVPQSSGSSTATNVKKLGADIYQASKKTAAVGKPEFDNLIKQINPNNVEAVLKNYTKKESLINTITSEIRSDKQKRKDTVMYVYDQLAKAKGTPQAIRKRFEKELNEQFDSFGMVNTKKLDRIMKNMMASPAELGANIFHEADDHWGAVGMDEFDTLIDMISPRNVASVITDYTKNPKNTKKESLINTITSEIHSDKQKRKDAVMHIYDALAKANNTPAVKREEFVKELNSQFGKKIGMVDTTRLDEMINSMLQGKAAKAAASSTSAASKKTSVPQNSTQVTVTNSGKKYTVSNLQRGAIASAKNEAKDKFKEFCTQNNIAYNEQLLDLSPLDRIPAPTVSNGKIVATESEVLQPTTQPNGKVVVVNAGHGGYSSRTGYFDCGSYSFINKANGKYAPLLEYDKMKIYADGLVEKLRSQGYAVVLMNAHAQTMSDQNSISNIVQKLHNGTKGSKKYAEENIMFVSLHADSEPGKSGTGICFDSTYADDTKLANTLKESLDSDDWISASTSERVWGNNGLQVLHQTENIPSVLVEVEYVNGSKSKNLDSSSFQTRFQNKLIEGINKYFGIGH